MKCRELKSKMMWSILLREVKHWLATYTNKWSLDASKRFMHLHFAKSSHRRQQDGCAKWKEPSCPHRSEARGVAKVDGQLDGLKCLYQSQQLRLQPLRTGSTGIIFIAYALQNPQNSVSDLSLVNVEGTIWMSQCSLDPCGRKSNSKFLKYIHMHLYLHLFIY